MDLGALFSRYRGTLRVLLLIGALFGLGFLNATDLINGARTLFLVAPANVFPRNLTFPSARHFLSFIFILILLYDWILRSTLRRQAFELLRTKVLVTFPALDGAAPSANNQHISRTQYIRANQPGIKAYHMRMAPMPGGTLEKEHIQIRYENEGLLCNPMILGSKSSWEIVDRLDQAFPFRLWLLSVPTRFFKMDKSKWIVRRVVDSTYKELSDLPEYYYGLIAARNQQRNITITARIPRSASLPHESIAGVKIRDNVVEDLFVFRPSAATDDFVEYEVRVPVLRSGERIRLTWKGF